MNTINERCDNVLLFNTLGMDDILPNRRPYIPRIGKVALLFLIQIRIFLHLLHISDFFIDYKIM